VREHHAFAVAPPGNGAIRRDTCQSTAAATTTAGHAHAATSTAQITLEILSHADADDRPAVGRERQMRDRHIQR
jgi:hypothetical protein